MDYSYNFSFSWISYIKTKVSHDVSLKNLKKLSFLVYGLGLTGQSVIKFFKKNKIKKYKVWDDKKKIYKKKADLKILNKALKKLII